MLALLLLAIAFTSLQERLADAKPNDYIATQWHRTTTLVVLRAISPDRLIVEEISAPSGLFRQPESWASWIQHKAPGHTSWSLLEIDPKTGEPIECFSFSRNGWVDISPQESFLATLLKLPLTQQPPHRHQRIGAPPLGGDTDFRKIWMPPFFRNGHTSSLKQCDIYETTWPNDQSDLAGQTVVLYFDGEKRSPFPCWIQVETGYLSTSIQILDSGSNLPTFYSGPPAREPQFVGTPELTDEQLRFRLQGLRAHSSFELVAIDITSDEKEIIPMPYSVTKAKGATLQIDVEKEELKAKLIPGHRYRWLLIPKDIKTPFAESDVLEWHE
jgi:hypothetical protein